MPPASRDGLLSYGERTDSPLLRLEAALLRRLPPRLRRPARRLLYLPVDLLDAATGRRRGLVPPRGRIGVGAGDFLATGEGYVRYLEKYGGLEPGSRVLDLGSGLGRMAIPLTAYLTDGRYDGVEVAASDVRWCRRHLSRRHRSFRFHHADVRNREYNPGGRLATAEYRLPLADASVDVALAASLFTHLSAPEVEHYLAETARVLRPGGRLLSTFFLLNEESRELIASGACGLAFEHRQGEAFVHDRRNPLAAVAYEESFVRALHQRHGLALREPVLYGCWCNRPEYLSYQDLIVAERS